VLNQYDFYLWRNLKQKAYPHRLHELKQSIHEFLTTLEVCAKKSSGQKAVELGRNNYLNWDYNLMKTRLILRGSGSKCLSSVLI
jgi:hypothetical protein